jgi:hypothetical protein
MNNDNLYIRTIVRMELTAHCPMGILYSTKDLMRYHGKAALILPGVPEPQFETRSSVGLNAICNPTIAGKV